MPKRSPETTFGVIKESPGGLFDEMQAERRENDLETFKRVFQTYPGRIKARGVRILKPRLPIPFLAHLGETKPHDKTAIADARLSYAQTSDEAKNIANTRASSGRDTVSSMLESMTTDIFNNPTSSVDTRDKFMNAEYLRYRQMIDFMTKQLATHYQHLDFYQKLDVFAVFIGFMEETRYQTTRVNDHPQNLILKYGLRSLEHVGFGDIVQYLFTQKAQLKADGFVADQVESALEIAGIQKEPERRLEAKGKYVFTSEDAYKKLAYILQHDIAMRKPDFRGPLSRWDLNFTAPDQQPRYTHHSGHSVRLRKRSKPGGDDRVIVVKGQKINHDRKAHIKVKKETEWSFPYPTKEDEHVYHRKELESALVDAYGLGRHEEESVFVSRIEYAFDTYGVKVSLDKITKKGEKPIFVFEIQALSENLDETPELVDRIERFMNEYGGKLGIPFTKLRPYTHRDILRKYGFQESGGSRRGRR